MQEVQETWVPSVAWEDSLEKEMATNSSILAWKIPRMEELGRLYSMGSQRVKHNWVTSLGRHLGFFNEILWPPNVKNWLIRKDPDAGEDWRQEEKGTTEDEMVGWHHRLNGHEFEQALGVGEGQGSLTHCSPWGHKESDTTEHVHIYNFTSS